MGNDQPKLDPEDGTVPKQQDDEGDLELDAGEVEKVTGGTGGYGVKGSKGMGN
jgi:hypothetical protein